ncbi:unnamed protein product [Nyctereutes procyonoides]|uniref:(raccoon dog) hypothetical protein n=1 Tax=Nyctereutes procyonoides TaxID=34880 RepID=A0A811Z3E0_NYCPR|nr:unnamed protein product [Nyctereutes procyonoides]
MVHPLLEKQSLLCFLFRLLQGDLSSSVLGFKNRTSRPLVF